MNIFRRTKSSTIYPVLLGLAALILVSLLTPSLAAIAPDSDHRKAAHSIAPAETRARSSVTPDSIVVADAATKRKIRRAERRVRVAKADVRKLNRDIRAAKNRIAQINRQIAAKRRWLNSKSTLDKIWAGPEFTAYAAAKNTEKGALYTKIGGLEAAKRTAIGTLIVAEKALRALR